MLKYSTVGSEILEGLEPNLAQEPLLKAAGIPKSLWKDKSEAALAAVGVLGLHTLAIVQAGAFIQQGRCTVEQYSVEFQQRKNILLKFNSLQLRSEYQNVYTTFEVSTQYLQRSESQGHLDALELLQALAFMHNNGISEEAFQLAIAYAQKIKDMNTNDEEHLDTYLESQIPRLPKCAQEEAPILFDRTRWRGACWTLESLSLINLSESSDLITISMHPLVHAWAKERLNHADRSKAWHSAVTIIQFSIEMAWTQVSHGSWIYSIHPHLRACLSHEIENYLNMSDLETVAMLLHFFVYLVNASDHVSIENLCNRFYSRLPNLDKTGEEHWL